MTKPLVWILNDVWEEHDYEMERLNEESFEVKVTRLEDFDADSEKYSSSASVVMSQVGFVVDKTLIDTLDQIEINSRLTDHHRLPLSILLQKTAVIAFAVTAVSICHLTSFTAK